ncbi:MAG: hypothetical protein IJZ32_03975 [Clostridia bacterium]|nr:hypothetical protein [Clostridia bacterium]
MKKKNKVLATSVATIALCASLVAGGTYALFTSESTVNIAVTSGTVDVVATASELTLYSKGVEQKGNTFENGGTATKVDNEISIDRMTPMDSVNFDIEIENYSDVSVQYRTVIKSVDDTGLFEALNVTFTEDEVSQTFEGGYAYADWATLDAGDNDPSTPEDVSTINVNIEFPNGDNQNGYQGKSCKLAVVVEAVQGNADVVNPVTQTGERSWDVNSEEGMMMMNGIIESNAHGEGKELNFKLTADMDMTGYAWTPLHAWWVNVDGDNHTVSNVNAGVGVYGRSGFIGYLGGSTLENVTLENVTACGTQAGVVAGSLEGATLTNVTIAGENSVTFDQSVNPAETWGGVGAVAGVSTSVKNSNVTIASGATVTVNYNDIISKAPFYNDYSQLQDISAYVTNSGTVAKTGEWLSYVADGVAQKIDGTYVITNANGLKWFSGKYIVSNNGTAETCNIELMNDVDLEGAEFAEIGVAYGDTLNFNGNGYTISNAKFTTGRHNGMTNIGMFYVDSGATLNVTDLNLASPVVADGVDEYSIGVAAVVGYANGAVNLTNVDVAGASVNNTKGNAAIYVGYCVNKVTLTNCDVTNSVASGEVEDGVVRADKTGAFGATVNTANCTFAVNNCTNDTELAVAGRVINGATMTIDGVPYVIVTSTDNSAISDVLKSAENGSTIALPEGTFTVGAAAGKTVTLVGNRDTKIDVTSGLTYVQGSEITFKGLTIQSEPEGAGYTNGLADAKNAVFEDCVINGTLGLDFSCEFKNCEFNITGDYYNVWTWGAGTVSFTECTFNCDGKALLVYANVLDNGTSHQTVNINKCTFNDNGDDTITGKAAIEITDTYPANNITYDVIINNTTVNGFSVTTQNSTTFGGSDLGTNVWGNKNLLTTDDLNVVIDGVDVH